MDVAEAVGLLVVMGVGDGVVVVEGVVGVLPGSLGCLEVVPSWVRCEVMEDGGKLHEGGVSWYAPFFRSLTSPQGLFPHPEVP